MNSVDLEFQVVDVRRKALLSAEASQLLGLVTIHIEDEGDEVNNMEGFWNGKPPMPPLDKEAILKDYGDAFDDLGCLPGKYHIEIDPTVKPSQNPLRRVPVATKSEEDQSDDQGRHPGKCIRIYQLDLKYGGSQEIE